MTPDEVNLLNHELKKLHHQIGEVMGRIEVRGAAQSVKTLYQSLASLRHTCEVALAGDISTLTDGEQRRLYGTLSSASATVQEVSLAFKRPTPLETLERLTEAVDKANVDLEHDTLHFRLPSSDERTRMSIVAREKAAASVDAQIEEILTRTRREAEAALAHVVNEAEREREAFRQKYDKANEEVAAMQRKVSDLQKATAEKLEETERLATQKLQAAEGAAALKGVVAEAAHFDREAKRNQIAAWIAFGLTCQGVIALIGFAVLCIAGYRLRWLVVDPGDTMGHIHLIAAKALIVSAIYYLTVTFGRRHLAFEHNVVVNRHRANAVMTYRSFINATSTAADRDKVLDKAASCIYAPQPSGFTKSDGADAAPPINLVNLGAGSIAGSQGKAP